MDNELLNTFLAEAEEHLDAINNLLLELEQSSFEDEEAQDELLRELHSLKGSARMVGVDAVEEVVHATETIVKNILEGKEEFTPTFMDIFFEVVDDIRSAVEQMRMEEDFLEPTHLSVLMDKLDLFLIDFDEDPEESKEIEPSDTGQEEQSTEHEVQWEQRDYRELQQRAKELDIAANQSKEELIKQISEYEEQDSKSSEADPGKRDDGEASPDEDMSDPADETTEDYLYDLWDPNDFGAMVEDYLAEARDMVNQLTNSLIELEEEQTPDRVAAIFRVAHTLKGSSGMIGLEALEDLAHAMEELLDEVRGGEREVTPELIDLLLICNDKIEEILALVEELEPVQIRVKHLLEGLHQFQEEGEVDIEQIRAIEGRETEPASGESEPAQEQETDKGKDKKENGSPKKQSDAKQSKKSKKSGESRVTESIRVNIDKIDDVINLVGELVINRGRMDQKLGELQDLEQELNNINELLQDVEANDETLERVQNELGLIGRAFQELSMEVDQSSDDISRVVTELQESVMRTRMVPIAQLFNKFPRLVRDTARETGKEVSLEIEGKETEMDKTVIEKIGDPLMHIIRNAIDHGIEDPETRKQAGKDPEGTLSIRAAYEGDLVIIEIKDDGGGVNTEVVREMGIEKGVVTEDEAEDLSDHEINQLIFEPGFSTAEQVTETSGRGVGMDVVRSNIMDLNGSVDMVSQPGEGTTFTIKLPLTLAIIQVLLVRIGERRFALPLSSVRETLRIRRENIRKIGNKEVFELRGETLSLLRLRDVLGYAAETTWTQDIYPVVIVQSGNQRMGILVDELKKKQEIVIKDLGTILNNVEFASGATIMGDGNVVIIVDLGQIIHKAEELKARAPASRPDPPSDPEPDPGSGEPDQQTPEEKSSANGLKILAVEDTDTQRLVMKQTLTQAGYDVVEAEDGQQALEKAKNQSFDVLATDVKMPNMDGYELTRALRKMESNQNIPILMISALDEKVDKMRGFDAGADDYLEKPYSNDELIQKIEGMVRSVV